MTSSLTESNGETASKQADAAVLGMLLSHSDVRVVSAKEARAPPRAAGSHSRVKAV